MELQTKIGIKKHLRMKVEGNRLRGAGHIQRLSEERLTKRAGKPKLVVEEEDQS